MSNDNQEHPFWPNNDRFKYRVWVHQANQYCANFSIDTDGVVWSGHGTFREGVVIEQCTGLEDADGKLIYEGDIIFQKIDGEDCHFFAVKWFDFRFVLARNDGRVFSPSFFINHKCEIHVVGNIHDNPELILTEKDRMIRQGIAEGKITTATQKWWESFSEEDLKKYLPLAPVIVNTKGDSK